MNTPLNIQSFLLFVCIGCQVGALNAQTPRSSCDKVDWSTLPSRFTHDATGQRVHQYAEKVEPIAQNRSDFQRSGFRQFRSTLQVGASADNMHIVEQWGNDVQPYEAWRFPYRPYGVPYQDWGPNTQFWGATPFWPGAFWPGAGGASPHLPMHGHMPMGGGADGAVHSGDMIDSMPTHSGFGATPPGHMPPGYYPPGYFPPGYGYGPHSYGPRTAPWNPGVGPWTDGYYQDAPQTPRMPDRQFFYTPSL